MNEITVVLSASVNIDGTIVVLVSLNGIHHLDPSIPSPGSVCLHIIDAFGIDTCRTGNNDLGVAETGAKFSGSAFYQSGPDDNSRCFHHGTILCSCDIEKMVLYLTPSSSKLERHGVQSVRARVTNLGLDIKDVRESIIRVYEHRFGEAERAGEDIADAARVEEARQRLSSQEWLFSI